MLAIGLVSVSFRNHAPEEILAKMSEAGLAIVEWGSDVHAPCDNIERLNEIARLQKKYGVECCSYGTYFRIGKNTPDEILKYIEAAKILGTDVIRIWCGDKSYSSLSKRKKEKILKDSIEVSKFAEKEKITLCLEFHPNTYTDNADSTINLIRTVNSESFRTYWQPNQYKAFEENIREATLLSPFAVNIHAFNWGRENRYPLIEAKEEWIAYLKLFRNKHNVLLEFMPDDRIESLAEEAESLGRIMNECK